MSHAAYKFSITIKSDDLPTVNCLRSLSQYSQKSGNNRIPWGGTKDQDWKRNDHCVTFRFTSQEYRSDFLAEAQRLLPISLWSVINQNDNDPASPQK